MARGGSGIGTLIGLGAAGLGVWWASTQNWFGLFGAPVAAVPATPASSGGIVPANTPMPTTIAATTTTPPATTPPPPVPAAIVKLIGPVTQTINNALKGTFSINGVSQSIAVIPGGDAYDDSGHGITAQLAAEGVTPAQLYAMLSAAYKPPATSTGRGGGVAAAHAAALGMAGPMVFANRGNYVRAGSRYR